MFPESGLFLRECYSLEGSSAVAYQQRGAKGTAECNWSPKLFKSNDSPLFVKVGMLRSKVVTFGEIMLRLAPPGHLRFAQARVLDATYAGAEANVAIALSSLGMPAVFVTRLPSNDLGDACLNYLRQFGVGTEKIVRGGKRLGIYFVEMGAVYRGNKVIYDREDSAFATIEPGEFDWRESFKDACWFHWTGITPGLSKGAAEICIEAAEMAKEKGLTTSCDLNYRSQLWKWGKTSAQVMPELMPYVDILIGNEEDAERIFGIKPPGVDVTKGKVPAESYKFVAQTLMEQFPNIKVVTFTLRGSLSASHNTWSGVSYDGKELYQAPTYDITHIVDRIGAGDSFAAGLIYGLQRQEKDLHKALDFAVAASCLKHTIYGDSFVVSLEEVQKLLKGERSGRISR